MAIGCGMIIMFVNGARHERRQPSAQRVRCIVQKVTVKLEIPVDGKAPFEHSYVKQVAETTDDTVAISRTAVAHLPEDERSKAALAYHVKAFNYGHDLLVRGVERAKGNRAAQGPAKEIQKGVDALVASGFSAEEARAMIIAQREAKGLAV